MTSFCFTKNVRNNFIFLKARALRGKKETEKKEANKFFNSKIFERYEISSI